MAISVNAIARGSMDALSIRENYRENKRNKIRFDQEQEDRTRTLDHQQRGIMGEQFAAEYTQYGGFDRMPEERQVHWANIAKKQAAGGKDDGTQIVRLHRDEGGNSVAEVAGKRPDGTPIKAGAPMSRGGGTDDDPIVVPPDGWGQVLLSSLAPFSPAAAELAKQRGYALDFGQVAGTAEEQPQATEPQSSPVGVPQNPMSARFQGQQQAETVPVPPWSTPGINPAAPDHRGSVAQGGGIPIDPQNPVVQMTYRAAQQVGLPQELTDMGLRVETAGGTILDNGGVSSARGPLQIVKPTFDGINDQYFGGQLDWNNDEDVALAGAKNLKVEFDRFGDPQVALAAHFIGGTKTAQLLRTGGVEALMAYEAPKQTKDGRTLSVGEYLARAAGVGTAEAAAVPQQSPVAEPAAPAGPPSLAEVAQRGQQQKSVLSKVGDVAGAAVMAVPNALQTAGQMMYDLPAKGVPAAIRAVEDSVKDPGRLIKNAAQDPAGNLDNWIARRGTLPQQTTEDNENIDAVNRAMIGEAAKRRDAAMAQLENPSTMSSMQNARKEKLQADVAKYDRAVTAMGREIASRASVTRKMNITRPVPPGERLAGTAIPAAQQQSAELRDLGVQSHTGKVQADAAVLSNSVRNGPAKRLTQQQIDAAARLAAAGKITPEQMQRYVNTGFLEKSELERIDPFQYTFERMPDGELRLIYAPSDQMLTERYEREGKDKDGNKSHGRNTESNAQFNQVLDFYKEAIDRDGGKEKLLYGRSVYENASRAMNILEDPELSLFLAQRGLINTGPDNRPDLANTPAAKLNEVLVTLDRYVRTNEQWRSRGAWKRFKDSFSGAEAPQTDPRAGFGRPDGKPGTETLRLPDGRMLDKAQALSKMRAAGMEGNDDELWGAALVEFGPG